MTEGSVVAVRSVAGRRGAVGLGPILVGPGVVYAFRRAGELVDPILPLFFGHASNPLKNGFYGLRRVWFQTLFSHAFPSRSWTEPLPPSYHPYASEATVIAD